MGAMDFFTDINLHKGQLLEFVVDSTTGVSAAPTKAGQMVYSAGQLYVATGTSSASDWTPLATGGDTTILTTQVGYLKTLVGMNDSGQATKANGTITKDVDDIKTKIGTTTISGDSLTAAIATAQSDISTNAGNISTNAGNISSLQTAVGASTDSPSVSGSLYARIAQLDTVKAPLASPAFTGTPTAPTAANGDNSTQIATTAFVMNTLGNTDAMMFKGILGTESGDVSTLPATHEAGWVYKVRASGTTWAGHTCEAGDLVICIKDGSAASDADWTVVQGNIDGAVTGPASSTDNHIATFNSTTGKVIKDSGFTIETSVPANAVFTDTTYAATSGQTTISGGNNAIGLATSGVTADSYGPSANVSPAIGGTFTVPYVTVDAYGRVTAAADKTITLPASDNVDEKVIQTQDTTTTTAIPILVAGTSTSGTAAQAKYTGVTIIPSSGTVSATTFSGNLTGNVTGDVTGDVTGNVSGSSGSCTGNAATATALAASKNFSITGGATAAAVAFDGSAAVELNVTSLDGTKVTGKIPETSSPYVMGTVSVTIATAGTAVSVTCPNLSGYPLTLTLFDANHKVCAAEITGTSGGASVTSNTTGTFTLGYCGLRA